MKSTEKPVKKGAAEKVVTEKVSKVAAKKQIRTLSGKVISNKMNKTVIVEITHQMRHALYGKTVKHSSHLAAHSEEVIAVGTSVTIQEVKPISKTKHFIVVKGNA